jgi:signal transduction histidine kinase
LKYNRGIIRYFSSEGEILNIKGKYAECLSMLQKGLGFAISGHDKMREGIMYENIGNTYGFMEKLDSSASYYFKALNVFEIIKDTVKIAIVYSNLSNVFTHTDNLQNALMYADKAIQVTQRKKDAYYLSALINKEAILWKLKEYQKATAVNNDIIALSKQLKDYWGLSDAFSNLCDHSKERKEYDKLSTYANDLMQICVKINSNEKMCLAYYWLAGAAYFNKNYSDALQYINQAITIAEQDSLVKRTKECYLLYSKIILAKDGNIILAEDYLNKADSIGQITLNENILKATHNAQEKYESEKKEQQLKLQEAVIRQERLWKYFLFGLIAALLVIGFIAQKAYHNRQQLLLSEKQIQEQKIAQLENEKQLAATQAVLKGQEEERSRLAKDLHDGLGGILSGVKYSFNNMKQQFILTEENAMAFEKSMAMLDESISELRRVAHNMMPETLIKLSLSEALQDYCQQITQSGAVKITYQSFGMEMVQLDNAVKTTTYRIVQELTNNILKHADATEVMIQLIAKENKLNITVEDNGKGFDVKQLSAASGIGYKNIHSRVDFLKGKLDVQSKPGEGTSVYMEIPLA